MFNHTATKLATASEKGTVIRVFCIPEGQKLFEFRRGMKRCVSISSLAFSADSVFLSASSNTETVHVFKLETQRDKSNEEPDGWMGYVSKALMSSASYLPSQVTDVFNQGRAFAIVKLPFAGLKNICALATIQKLPRVLVASQDGYLYIYNLDPAEGGDCTLLKQHRLIGDLGSEGFGETTEKMFTKPGGPPTFAAAAAVGSRTTDTTTEIVSEDCAEGLDEAATAADLLGTAARENTPTMDTLKLDDENEFPPMTHDVA